MSLLAIFTIKTKTINPKQNYNHIFIHKKSNKLYRCNKNIHATMKSLSRDIKHGGFVWLFVLVLKWHHDISAAGAESCQQSEKCYTMTSPILKRWSRNRKYDNSKNLFQSEYGPKMRYYYTRWVCFDEAAYKCKLFMKEISSLSINLNKSQQQKYFTPSTRQKGNRRIKFAHSKVTSFINEDELMVDNGRFVLNRSSN